MSGLMKNNDRLPEGWDIVTLNDICEINPRLDKSKIPADLEVAFVPMASVGAGDGKIDVSYKRPFSEVKKGFTPFQAGDVLFAKITPCMENGKIVVVPHLENNCGFGSTEFHVIRPKDVVDARYIYYYISKLDYRKEAASKMTGAVGQKRVPANFVKLSTILLAPLNEQKLIVSEIEKQFSRLDEAVAALKRVRASLKRYKASVLKAAVEGKLTEEWRKQNPNIEPADKLLKRILLERKKKWEETKPKKKYKEPVAPDTSNLPELPKGWGWVNFVQLVSANKNSIKRGPFGSAIKKAYFVQEGYKVYEQQNAIYNNFKLGNYYINEEKYNELSGFTVNSGDFIVSCSGTIGKIAQMPESAEKGVINQALLKITIDHKLILSKYFLYLFKSYDFQKMFLKDIRGTAMKNIASVEDLKLIPVALPPANEQTVIIEEIESRLSVAEEIEEAINI
ncbi:MAG: restriction endonuclease subunit S, partial [Candidatus Subteraquimicrobiales bacterium]|nr:restriction endonuclease subunit S [Candidatus Subteraquimicrobiales bacterium]